MQHWITSITTQVEDGDSTWVHLSWVHFTIQVDILTKSIVWIYSFHFQHTIVLAVLLIGVIFLLLQYLSYWIGKSTQFVTRWAIWYRFRFFSGHLNFVLEMVTSWQNWNGTEMAFNVTFKVYLKWAVSVSEMFTEWHNLNGT